MRSAARLLANAVVAVLLETAFRRCAAGGYRVAIAGTQAKCGNIAQPVLAPLFNPMNELAGSATSQWSVVRISVTRFARLSAMRNVMK